ncbi:hypothetical protein [Paraburkholderia acidipaludis]|uniref:hypothetical protein n=1 Tax=Paraburkholderia acidipaludis TaxID=660537 RepID=UPI0004804A71|nr:hypothetical protein [Paraburkholderia acidipaludis]
MSADVQGATDRKSDSLWARAPLWRACLSVAVLLSAGVVCFPPSWRTVDNTPLPALPESIAYHAPPAPVVPPAESIARTATAATPQPAATQGASAAIVARAEAKGRQAKAAMTTADSNMPAKALPKASAQAPVNAQISMAVPTATTSSDASGLNSAFVGRTYRQSIAVAGYEVPLPPGQWAMLANSSIKARGGSGIAYFLGRIEHRRLVGAVRVFAVHSNDQPGTGFPAASGCVSGNHDVNYLSLDSVTPFGHQACWLINNYFTPPWQQWADRATRMSALDRAAAGDLAAKGVDYPQDLVDVRFTRAETWGLLEVSYLFDPELDGVTSGTALSVRDSEWHGPNADRFPDKLAYIAKMRDWGEGFWPKFQAAFDTGMPPSFSSGSDGRKEFSAMPGSGPAAP